MALNPESQYPGKIAPSTAAYPYGQARNITVPGDGTGTPWEAALVNDLFGLQQALLSEAAIVPNGAPDTATASQYLTALNFTKGKVVGDYTAAKALNFSQFKDGTALFVLDPLRGGMFAWDSSDLSTEVATDGQEGIYVAPDSDPSGASGALVRSLHGQPATPEMFGAVGDGAYTVVSGQNVYTGADDSAALNGMVTVCSHCRLTPQKNYNLNGNTWTVPNGVVLESSKASKIMNGTLTCRINNGSGNRFGDLALYDVSAQFGAINSLEANHYKGMVIGDIYCEGNAKLNLLYHNDLTCGDITINMLNDGGVARQAMGWAGLYECTLGEVKISGYFSMGFETITSDGYASRSTYIKKLVCRRNLSAVSVAGEHGFYLRHNYDLQVPGGVTSTGYDVADAGVSNCFKFRDNWKCKIGPVLATTVNLASDGNSAVFNSMVDNVIESIDTRTDQTDQTVFGDVRITTNSPGEMGNNFVTNGFYGQCTTSGNLLSDPDYPAWTLSGQVVLANESNLQLDDIVFRKARVKWLHAATYYYNRFLRAYYCEFLDRIETNNTSMTLENCNVDGDIRLDLTTGTQTLILKNVTCTGEIFTNSATTRVVNATWWNVVSGQNRPASSSSRPDGVLDFKSVFFQDGYYLDQTTFVTPYV